MNRLTDLFASKKENVLNIYFTAGYPALEDTVAVLKSFFFGIMVEEIIENSHNHGKPTKTGFGIVSINPL